MRRDTLLTIKLPTGNHAVREPAAFARPKRAFTRKALAAAHDPPLACARMKQLLAVHGCA